MSTPPAPHPADRPTVVAVVVAHHGTRWLPGLQAALAAQTRPPDVVVAADTSAADDQNRSLGALVDWLGAGRVVDLPARNGFGAAVGAALGRTSAPAAYVWLLHDDCAPAPDALEQLLAETTRDPQVGIVGPKVLGLGDRRLLLEAGVTIARSGRRETGLERREQDQGQHDGVRTVLAVGSAGMLVRRDVWDELGGFDPQLPLLRDDVDLGWRANLAGHRVVVATDAVVHHAEASSHRRRSVHAAGGRLHRLDRQHALYVLLANLPLLRVPFAALHLTLSTLVRALGLLAGKRPGHAADEVVALLAVVGRPDRLLRARLARRRTRRLPARSVSPLLAPRGAGLRHGMEALSIFLGTRAGDALGGRHRASTVLATETGPTSEDADDLPGSGAGAIRRLLLQPTVLLTAGLVLLAVLADRQLVGDGRLMGGALLPTPAAASGLWQRYLASWHPVGLGGDTGAPPYLAVLALLGNVLLGSAERAVDLLLLGAVPLAGLSAYAGLRRLTASVPLRLWGSVSYALLPPLLGAVATGRLGTVVLALLLPLLVLALVRALGPAGGASSWRAAWTAAVLLALVAAFVPAVWVVALLALVVVGAVVRRRALLARCAAVAVAPVVLLAPWLPGLAERPELLLLQAGLPGPDLTERDLGGLDLLLLHAGGPGVPPLVLGAGLLVAALAGLLRRDRRRVVLVGWAVVLGSLAGALVLARTTVTAPTLESPVAAWPGGLLMLAGAGMVVAAVAGAAGARSRVAGASFGWRQPTALLVLVVALAAPLALAGWWAVTAADGPLARRDPVLLPAFVAAEGSQPSRPRTLVLRVRDDGRIAYSVLRSDGPRTGDAEVTPASQTPRLDAAVADLASGRGGDAAGRLVPFGIRFVLLTTPAAERVVRAVESVPGVVQVSGQEDARLWRIDYPVARARVLAPGAPVVEQDGAPPAATVVPAGQVTVRTELSAGRAGRLLVLADAADPGWRATLDGHPLPSTRYAGWAQAFELPAQGGRLEVEHEDGVRRALLWLQLAALVVLVVLALPQARSTLDEDEGAAADLPEPIAVGAAPRSEEVRS